MGGLAGKDPPRLEPAHHSPTYPGRRVGGWGPGVGGGAGLRAESHKGSIAMILEAI